MQKNVMRTAALLFLLLLAVSNMLWSAAQDTTPTPDPSQSPIPVSVVSASECATGLSVVWLNASDACVGKPFGYVCNGGLSPQVEPAGGVSQALATLGSLVETNVVDSLRTAPLSSHGLDGGVAWLRVAAPDTLVQFSGLMVGDVQVRDVTPADYNAPAWQSFVVETRDAPERCEIAPHSSLILQNLPGQSARLVVNAVSLDITGTVVVQTYDNHTHFLVLAGDLRLLTNNHRANVFAGQEVSIPYHSGDYGNPTGAPSQPTNFSEERIDHLPVLLLDRPVTVPEAGYATTQGPVNMRTAPSLDAAVLLQAPANERLLVLGRNPAGDWYHVRLSTGVTGWMFSELLLGDLGDIKKVYSETPLPPQRLGDLGEKAKVIAPNGVGLRTAPDPSFSVLGTAQFGREVKIVARSPYNQWLKIDADGLIGWVSLITLETQAIYDSIPIDYDVPPPPTPTRVPGTFGNAFPDPNCYPNCKQGGQ